MDVLLKICSFPAEALSRLPVIGPLIKVCCTSVGQKILMALTGLALCGFLVAHLAGNLLLYSGAEQFNEYAERLHSLGPVLWAAELGLLATFVIHICLAVSTAAMSLRARGSSYAEKESKQSTFVLLGGGASNWMVPTGLAILVFLILHVSDMKFNLRGVGVGEEDTFEHVKAVLNNNVTRIVYLIGLVALGIHLSHGVSSAFQTLGINHARWNGLIRIAGVLFAWAIALGFMSLLAWAFNAAAAAAG
ncbi:MAG: succinate dehydrogenase cytochrome b subunit [Fuerstiella sp.]